jgi:hypothetical protein
MNLFDIFGLEPKKMLISVRAKIEQNYVLWCVLAFKRFCNEFVRKGEVLTDSIYDKT